MKKLTKKKQDIVIRVLEGFYGTNISNVHESTRFYREDYADFSVPLVTASKYANEDIINTLKDYVTITENDQYGTASSPADMFMRMRFFLSLYVISQKTDYDDVIARTDALNDHFINYRKAITDTTEERTRMILHAAKGRVREILRINDGTLDGRKYDHVISDVKSLYFPNGIEDKLVDCKGVYIHHISTAIHLLKSMFMLCTNVPYNKILLIMDDIYVKFSLKKMNDYIKNNKSVSFECWLDSRGATPVDATPDSWYVYQALAFTYMMMSGRSIHQNVYKPTELLDVL
jgi:hypothetical protein